MATNLPQPLTSFVGRAQEVLAVQEALGSIRLLTLTGMGGIGKTRLALEVAHGMTAAFSNGIWFVALGALTAPEQVRQAVAMALDVRETPGRSLSSVVTELLCGGRSLLVLDNCEHLVETCATLVGDFLRACPELVVLATSREALGVAGERRWTVAPLALAETDAHGAQDDLLGSEAVRLFVERAMAVNPGLSPDPLVIARLCQRLDGIPLALELAAVRVRVFSVGQILERLEDRFRLLTGGDRAALPHQQTLRATIDWSHELLSAEEQTLFRRLSIFAGGWTLDAVEGVVDKDEGGRMKEESEGALLHPASFVLHPSDVLQYLERLVDKSLVLVKSYGDEPRYGMLETVRQYAEKRLREADEYQRTVTAHIAWFLRLAAHVESATGRADEAVWLRRVEDDYDNWRAALRSSADEADTSDALARLCCALGWFWRVRGRWSEGRAWLERALSTDGARAPMLRARLLWVVCNLSRAQGDSTRVRERLEESKTLYQSLGARKEMALPLRHLGHLLLDEGSAGEAEAFALESLAISEDLGDRIGYAQTANLLGRIAESQGNYDRAEYWFEQSLSVYGPSGRQYDAAITTLNLGLIAERRGAHERAAELLEESLVAARAIGYVQCAAHALQGLGEVDRHRGDFASAEAHFRQGLTEARKLGDKQLTATCFVSLGDLANDRGDFADARSCYVDALATDKERFHKAIIIDVIDGFVRGAAAQGNARRALLLAAAATALRSTIGVSLGPDEQEVVERTLAPVRRALTPEDAEAATAEGRVMSLEEAIAYALQDIG